jgi:hypothetical protein
VSAAAAAKGRSGSDESPSPSLPLFEHEVRRDGHVVANLRAFETPTGVTVASEVYPLTQPKGADPVTRPFAFPTLDHARRFADEALVAFEYLSCDVS